MASENNCDFKPIVLFLDDEPDILLEYRDYFASNGICSVAESHAKEAVTQLLTQPSIKIVVTDMRMPDIDGRAFTQIAKTAISSDRKIAFIWVTGYVDTDQVSLNEEAFAILRKPIDPDELLAAVRDCLQFLANDAQSNR